MLYFDPLYASFCLYSYVLLLNLTPNFLIQEKFCFANLVPNFSIYANWLKIKLLKIPIIVFGKQWISYLLTHEKIIHVIYTANPKVEDPQDIMTSKLRDKWEEENELTRAIIFMYIDDDIIPLYEEYKTAREILDALDAKYGPISYIHI